MSEFKGVAYERGDVTISVGYVPERERPALYTSRGNVSAVHGYFRDEESAQAFICSMAYLLTGEGADKVTAALSGPPVVRRLNRAPRPSGVRQLPDEEVIKARELRQAGMAVSDLAVMYGTSKTCMAMLLRGLTYASVGGPIVVGRRVQPVIPH